MIPGPSNIQQKKQHSFCQTNKHQRMEGSNLNKPPLLAMGSDLCYWGEESGRIHESQRTYNQVAGDCWWRKCSENDK